MSAISSVCEWYIHITELPFIGPGSGSLGDLPGVGDGPSGRHRVVGLVRSPGAVGVRRSLRALGVEDAVRVHRCRDRVLFLKTTLIVSPTSARITGPSMPRCWPVGRDAASGTWRRCTRGTAPCGRCRRCGVGPFCTKTFSSSVNGWPVIWLLPRRRVVPQHLVRGDEVGADLARRGRHRLQLLRRRVAQLVASMSSPRQAARAHTGLATPYRSRTRATAAVTTTSRN